MNEGVERMLSKYALETGTSTLRALREILQEISLLGLWRAKFFEEAAFYGGTALRVLYGADRFSEDLDFSLLNPRREFDLAPYAERLQAEVRSFGFEVEVTPKPKTSQSALQSAFLKAGTLEQLLVIRAPKTILTSISRGQVLKIKLEVDTDPPPLFETEVRYLVNPIPFSVRAYALPDMFAGKVHALLCRRWKTRVKGRDWYDFAWFAAYHPALNLAHLRELMVQSGHWDVNHPLTPEAFRDLLKRTIEGVDLDAARNEVAPFVIQPESLELWSRHFFLDMAGRIRKDEY